jgi:hypothetical protein
MDETIKYLLRDKLEHHEVPVDAADWEIVRRRLQQQKQRKAVMIWFPIGAAAAVAALCFMLYHPSVDERSPVLQPLADLPSLFIAVPHEVRQLESIPANDVTTTTNTTIRKTIVPLPEQPVSEIVHHEITAVTDSPADTAQAVKALAQMQPTVQDSLLTALLAEERAQPEQTERKKWAVALLANQSGSIGFPNTAGQDESYVFDAPSLNAPPEVTAGTEYIPAQPTETTHYMPLSFGLTFRFYFTSRWAIESGLVYTYLSSEYKYGPNYRLKQRLHYLGLPVNAVYQFVGSKRFSVYVSGGGMLEKGISADCKIITPSSQTNSHENIAGVQWSLNGQLGVSYNFSKRFSLYAEPGVRYFFPDARQPESVRTEQPFNFSLGFGLRTNF